MHRWVVVVVAALLLCEAGGGSGGRPDTSTGSGEGRLVLWAWERPERLGFIDPHDVAVAFLAETVVLSGDTVSATPRRQPLSVPVATHMIAVVRVETRRLRPPSLNLAQQKTAADRLLAVVDRTGVQALQVDFDASVSERAFYGGMLADVRQRLPIGIRLLITALASWCMDDPWIAHLPIDRAVPMLFRMGPEGPAIRRRIGGGEDFSLSMCRSDVGVSMDEAWVRRAARYWVFSPRAWSQTSVAAAVRSTGAEGDQ